MTGNYVLSCASPRGLSTAFKKEITDLLTRHGLSVHSEMNLSERDLTAMNFMISAENNLDFELIKADLIIISDKHQTDVAFLRDEDFRKRKKLIVFDMDSTLIQAEVIDEMAALHGVGDRVKKITERAMKGEINFDGALRERVSLLKGMKEERLYEINQRLPLTPGVKEFIQAVKARGLKTAIVSGGFRLFAEDLKIRLGMDHAFANELVIENGVLTGQVKGEIINARRKAEILEELARQEGFDLEEVVAVGDGANDLLMLAKAGMGVAFHAKEKVRREAGHRLSHGPMTTLLYFLGVPGDHF